MEAGELAEADQAGDDLLDVGVGRVVAEIDQALGLGPQFRAASRARAPVRDHRGIEGRLEELVLEEHPPVLGQRA